MEKDSCQQERVCLESDFRQCRVEWLKEHLQQSDGGRVECSEIKHSLHQALGYLSQQELGHSVRSAFPHVSHKRARVGGKLTYFYYGVQWVEQFAVQQEPPLVETESAETILEHSQTYEEVQHRDSRVVQQPCGSDLGSMDLSPHSYLPPFTDSPGSTYSPESTSARISGTSRNTTTTLEGQKCFIPDYGMTALRMKNIQRKVTTLHGKVQLFFDHTTTCIVIDKQAITKGLILGERIDDVLDKLRDKNVPVIDVADLSPIRRLEFD